MKLIFAGTPENAATALELISAKHEVVLVITREDAPVGRKRVLTPSPVAQIAQSLGLPVLKANRLSAVSETELKEAGAELAIVVAYGALVPQRLLDALPWWNLHFSLLPEWRGATPLQHSMLTGGLGSGVTLFELEAGLDTGAVLSQKPIQIDFEKTCGELLEEFTKAGVEMTLEALAGRPKAMPQQGTASTAPKLYREHGKLDFSKSADELMWQVMALNPEPMAWCELDGNPLRILRARSLGATDWDSLDGVQHLPGEVVASNKVLVACGGGTRLELLQVQPAGKKEMSAGDWIRGLAKKVTLE